ncbi:MAG: hypothetical protein NTV05_16050 [Acidobacteria bacterium]|nr:hypothetical protein [Acidobacteriota bacterium]
MSRQTLAATTWPAVGALIIGAENPLRRRYATHDRVTAAFLIVAALLLPTSALAQSGQIVEYYHLDALGSVRVVTDQTGQVVARHDFLPFGEEWNPPANAKEKKLFTGHERDAETGLDYFGARYYRPTSPIRSGGIGTRTSGIARSSTRIRMAGTRSYYRPYSGSQTPRSPSALRSGRRRKRRRRGFGQRGSSIHRAGMRPCRPRAKC